MKHKTAIEERRPNWEDLMTLAALVREGSYSAAARELSVTHATISRRISRLEESLGATVLTWRNSLLQLSPTGRAALAAAQEMEHSAEALARNLDSDQHDPIGTIRVTATEALGTWFYLPRLRGFQRAHPRIALELILDNRVLSLAKRKADIAIRLARPTEEGLVAKRLGSLDYALYVRRDHPCLVEEGARDRIPDRIPHCQLDEAFRDLPESRWTSEHLDPTSCVFRASGLTALHQAVKAGFGAALIPSFLAGDDDELLCLTQGPALSREIWLAYPSEYRNTPRYRAIIDWLIDSTAKGAALLTMTPSGAGPEERRASERF